MSVKRSELEIVTDYMAGINEMADACRQMIHQHTNLKWMAMYDMLIRIKDVQVAAIKEEAAKL